MGKRIWTEFEDTTLYDLRCQGVAWADISAVFKIPVSSCMDRARAIGAGRKFMENNRKTVAPSVEWIEPTDDSRLPLPPGHPRTWGLLTTGTSLEGSAYTYQINGDL